MGGYSLQYAVTSFGETDGNCQVLQGLSCIYIKAFYRSIKQIDIFGRLKAVPKKQFPIPSRQFPVNLKDLQDL
jgi:hypothetical protein